MREETRLNFRPDLCAASTRQARTWCKLRTLMLSLLFCSAFSINRGNARGEKIASVYGRVDKLEEIERERDRERGIKKKRKNLFESVVQFVHGVWYRCTILS